ncbi:MAG TPA: FAD-binding protein [Thermodesulfobacteriota bacterium]|nr:FAD-binding protein [Thermodesulfobacteriota bacterium]
MEILSTDILIIGSGLAGTVAALESERSGLQTLLLGKFAIGMGTNSSIANGGFTAANSRFSKENHLHTTLETGRGLNRVSLVKNMVGHGPEAMVWLRSHGIDLAESGLGYWVGRPEGSSELPGVLLMKALVERLKKGTTRLLPGFVVFDLVVEEGEVRGAFGFSRDGKPCLIRSKVTVLAAGGAGAIYRRNDNQRSILGDGYSLVLRVGLPLYDLEFVQFYPVVLAEPRLSTFMLYPPYPKESRLFNEKGKDLAGSFDIPEDLNRAIMTQRDRFSIALYEASQKGDVYLDLTQVPEKTWEQYPLNFLRRSKFPFRERPFLIAPAVHFFMGGIEIDDQGKTALPGLIAAGEVAWGIHGANRLGGNALTECAVFGVIAGRSASKSAKMKGGEANLPSEAVVKRWERKAGEYLKKRRGVFDPPRNLLRDLKEIAWKYTGPKREEGSLNEGLDRLTNLETKIERIYPATLKDLLQKRDLENMALLLKALLKGSLLRQESRGSFYRKDFPNQDDPNWLKNSRYRLVQGELEVTHHSCTQP